MSMNSQSSRREFLAASAKVAAIAGLATTGCSAVGGGSGLKWRYFKPKEAPGQKLIRTPLPGPSYCREQLKWYEKEWAPTEKQRDGFTYMSKMFYDHLYKVLREGAPLQITPEQVAVQVAVMEECHRQCPLSKLRRKGWPKGN